MSIGREDRSDNEYLKVNKEEASSLENEDVKEYGTRLEELKEEIKSLKKIKKQQKKINKLEEEKLDVIREIDKKRISGKKFKRGKKH